MTQADSEENKSLPNRRNSTVFGALSALAQQRFVSLMATCEITRDAVNRFAQAACGLVGIQGPDEEKEEEG
jgi:hypothetical protein